MSEDIFSMDLENVEEFKDFSPIKPGPQRIRVTKIENGIAKSGNPKWVVAYQYVNIDNLVPLMEGGKVGELAPTKHLALTQKALPFLRRFVEAHGVTWDAFKANRDPQQFVGMEADVVIGLGTNDDTGARFNQIGRYVASNSVTA